MTHWFAYPLALSLFGLLPLLGSFVLWGWLRRRQALARFGTLTTLETVLTVRRFPRFLRGLCGFVGLLWLLAGIAGPQWGRDWKQATAPGRDVVVVLDCSRSMLAESPSRLELARAFAVDLSEAVQKRGGHRLGLVVFAGRAKLVCPLTHDYAYFREVLNSLDPNTMDLELAPGPRDEAGTRIGAALSLAVRSHDERFHGARDVLLLSDGDDPQRDGEWKQGAAEARAQGIPVLVVGVGDPNKAGTIPAANGVLHDPNGNEVRTRLEEAPLREIALTTQGAYIAAQTRRVAAGPVYLDAIAGLPMRESDEDVLPAYHRRHAWFYLPALALFALALIVPDRLPRFRTHWQKLVVRVQRTKVPRPKIAAAAAFVVALLFLGAAKIADPQTLVQEGDAAAASGNYTAAAALYQQAEARTTEPVAVAYRLAVVKYQLGIVSAGKDRELYNAEQLFRCCLGDKEYQATALFGLGNCLLARAHERNLDLARAAVEAYEQSLQVPGIPDKLADDARYNLERARLLTLQLLAPATKPDDPKNNPPDQEPPNNPPDPPGSNPNDPSKVPKGTDPGNGSANPDPRGQPIKANPDVGTKPIQTDQAAPGVGTLTPIPDLAEPTPLPTPEALSHLESATQRVLHDRKMYRMLKVRPPAPGVRDW